MKNLTGSEAVSNRDDYSLLFLCSIKCVAVCRCMNKKKSNSTSRSSYSNSLKHDVAAATINNKQSYKLIFNDMEKHIIV